jgi:Fe-S-cluster containining protein
MTKHKCQRCGRCCMHMHSDGTDMPCESLLIEDGIATCLAHGTHAKLGVCIEYPFDNEPCWFDMDYRPEGRRSEQGQAIQ